MNDAVTKCDAQVSYVLQSLDKQPDICGNKILFPSSYRSNQ